MQNAHTLLLLWIDIHICNCAVWMTLMLTKRDYSFYWLLFRKFNVLVPKHVVSLYKL